MKDIGVIDFSTDDAASARARLEARLREVGHWEQEASAEDPLRTIARAIYEVANVLRSRP